LFEEREKEKKEEEGREGEEEQLDGEIEMTQTNKEEVGVAMAMAMRIEYCCGSPRWLVPPPIFIRENIGARKWAGLWFILQAAVGS